MDFICKKKRRNKSIYVFEIRNVCNFPSLDLMYLLNLREHVLNNIKIELNEHIKTHKKHSYLVNINGEEKLFRVRNLRYQKFAYLRAKAYFDRITNPENFQFF